MNHFQLLFFHCCYWLITFVYCHVQLISSAKISIDYSFNYPGSRDLSWRYVSTFSTIAPTCDLGFKFISVESRLSHKEQQKDSRLRRQPQNQNLPTDYRRSTHLKRGIRAPSQASQQPIFFVCALIDSTGRPLNHTSFRGFGALKAAHSFWCPVWTYHGPCTVRPNVIFIFCTFQHLSKQEIFNVLVLLSSLNYFYLKQTNCCEAYFLLFILSKRFGF